MATQRVAMINSNNTQKNSDYDFSKITKWLLGNKGGIEASSMFTWDNTSKRLSAGTDIATAYVLCTRATSSPIPNQKFLAQFEFTGYLDFLNGTDGDKIFVEIKERLIKDPSLIEDLDSNTSYAQGLGIGEIKIAKSYPSHSNYLPLWEIQGGQAVDKRKVISIPALDEVSQRTTTLEAKVQRAEGSISTLQENRAPLYLAEYNQVMEDYQLSDQMVKHQFATDDEAFYWFPLGQNANNINIEIWFVCSGKPLQSLSVFVSQEWNANRGLDCHFYRAEEVEIDGKRTWRRTGGLIEGSRIEGRIEANKTKVKIIPNNPITMPKGTKMVAVVFPVNNTINNERYYKIYGNPFLSSAASPVSYKTSGNQRLALNTLMFLQGGGLEKNLIIKKKNLTLSEVVSYTGRDRIFRRQVPKTWMYFISLETSLWRDDRVEVYLWDSKTVDTSDFRNRIIRGQARFLIKWERIEARCSRDDAQWDRWYFKIEEISLGAQGVVAFPRVQKNSTEMAECTKLWEHIDGTKIYYQGKIDLNLTTSWGVAGSWESPSDGILYYKYNTIDTNGQIRHQQINNKIITFTKSGEGCLFVKKEERLNISTNYRFNSITDRYENGSITLTHFIPFQ